MKKCVVTFDCFKMYYDTCVKIDDAFSRDSFLNGVSKEMFRLFSDDINSSVFLFEFRSPKFLRFFFSNKVVSRLLSKDKRYDEWRGGVFECVSHIIINERYTFDFLRGLIESDAVDRNIVSLTRDDIRRYTVNDFSIESIEDDDMDSSDVLMILLSLCFVFMPKDISDFKRLISIKSLSV